MALTMSDEQERARRKRLASPHVLMSGECFCANCGAIAFKCELDATRAALAEAEQRLKAGSAWVTEAQRLTQDALAAAQAEALKAREALAALLYTERADSVAQAEKYEAWQRAFLDAEAILSRPPGEREALREMLEQMFDATLQATRSRCDCDAEPSWSRDAVVARLLGEEVKPRPRRLRTPSRGPSRRWNPR